MRDDMSPGEKQVTTRWLQVLWGQYTAAVEARRELSPGTIDDYSNRFAERLAESGGNTARLALDAGLVERNESVVLLVTGTGLKDVPAAARAVQRPDPVEPSLEMVALRLGL